VPTDARQDRHLGSLFTWRYETTGSPPTRNSVLLRKIPGPNGFLATRHGPGGPWTFEYGEQRGSRFFTDEAGTFVQDVDYQPFGKPDSTGAQPGSQLYSNKQWNSGDALAALGISQLGARLYDPAIGRFISRDPLLTTRTAATTNPYSFADNDPVNSADPTGLQKASRDPVINQEISISISITFKPEHTLEGPTPEETYIVTDPEFPWEERDPWAHTQSSDTTGRGSSRAPHPGATALPKIKLAWANYVTTLVAGVAAGVAAGSSGVAGATGASAVVTAGGATVGGAALAAGGIVLGAIEGVAYLNAKYGIDPDYAWCGGDAQCMHAIFYGKEQAEAHRLEVIRERAQLAQREADSIHLYRGVTVGHEGYERATRGIVLPIGGHDDPIEHNRGNTNSIYTSWTTRQGVAAWYALKAGSGVVLDAWIRRSRVVESVDVFNEGEWLVIGPVFGAKRTFVP